MVNLMSKRNFLFIVEGETDEPIFLKRLFSKCYSKQEYKIYTYKTNLHTLAKHLEDDYPDFDKNESDICLILRSYERSKSKRAVLSDRYTDIFLILDFEPHHDCPHFNTIHRMVSFYNDSTAQGKLFINYPMMQSYKHFDSLPDNKFYDTKITVEDCKQYKRIVGSLSGYTDTTKYTYPIFISLTVHHLKKANYILTGCYDIPTVDEYITWDYTTIFDKQISAKNQYHVIYVLNTCIFILVDYRPVSFFRQLSDRKCQFLI